MSRPVILVDLDNVVYDWAASMAEWLDQNGALPAQIYETVQEGRFLGRGPKHAMKAYKTWQVWEDWNIPKGEFIRWWRLGVEAGEIYGKGPLIAGARNALWELSDGEWDIHIATSRLTKFGLHDQIVINSATWLRDNNIPYRNIHFTDNKIAIRADAIVDDRADYMDHKAHGRTFEFPANHNQERFVEPAEQVRAWKGIVAELV
jgi:5'-nucleotidase